MKSHPRDARPSDRPPLQLVHPQPQSSLTELLVCLGLVLAGLVAAAFYAGNAPFGAAAALSLALLGRATYVTHVLRLPREVHPLDRSRHAAARR